MRIFKTLTTWQNFRKTLAKEDLGFVPTMGALHDGHLSLVEKSLSQNRFTCVSIFVNPTQFNDKNDYSKYPNRLQADTKTLEKLGVNALIVPKEKDIYHDEFNFTVAENSLSKILEGKFRPGHFEGVLTVVAKLLNIVRPKNVYFGKKDFQQYLLIKKMVRALFFDCRVVLCETKREKSGLALSSRNLLLSQKQREYAAWFYKILKKNVSDNKKRELLEELGFEVDYVQTYSKRVLGAIHYKGVRLIDNVTK